MEENIMNLKKILAGVVAGAMAVSAMAVGAFAEKIGASDPWKNVLISNETLAEAGITFNAGETLFVTYEIAVAIPEDQVNWSQVETTVNYDGAKANDCINACQAFFDNPDQAWAKTKVNNVIENNQTFKYSMTIHATDWFQVMIATNNEAAFDLKSITIANETKDIAVYADGKLAAPAEPTPDDPKPEGLETVLAVQDNKTWATVKSEKVNVAIGNEYTYSLTGLDIEPSTLTVMYIKDVAAMDLPEGTDPEASKIDPVKVTFTSVKINGKDITVKEGMSTGLDKNGIFDFALYNTWGTSYIDLPEENINTVEITIKVEAAEEPVESSSSSEEPVESSSSSEEPAESTSESSATEASVAEVTTGAGTTAPADDKNQPTGIALAVIPAVVAAAGVIVAKKRK